jgi:hypothetical protein
MKPKKHVVESMKAAASILGVDKTEVQWAKAEGCRAFRPGNRIDVGELRVWFADKVQKKKPTAVRDFDAGLEGAVWLMRKWKGPSNQAPVSFTPSATLMCWAVAGLKAMGCKKDDVAIYIVREFMRDIRAGVGDELFRQDTSP